MLSDFSRMGCMLQPPEHRRRRVIVRSYFYYRSFRFSRICSLIMLSSFPVISLFKVL